MPRPGDLTPEQAAAEAQRLRERWREADRIAAPLYAETYALLNATEEELRDVLPHEDVDQILEYRSQPALVVDEQIRRLPLRPQPPISETVGSTPLRLAAGNSTPVRLTSAPSSASWPRTLLAGDDVRVVFSLKFGHVVARLETTGPFYDADLVRIGGMPDEIESLGAFTPDSLTVELGHVNEFIATPGDLSGAIRDDLELWID